MSDFFGHVAGAALPVAITLLVLTAVARGVLWAQLEGDERRLAQQYLAPLATWCLIAAGTYALAAGAAGDAGVITLGAALLMALAAALLRSDAAPEAPQPRPEAARPRPEVAQPMPKAAPSETSLWDDASESPRTGLWAR